MSSGNQYGIGEERSMASLSEENSLMFSKFYNLEDKT